MKNKDQLGFDTDNELLNSVYQTAPEKKHDKDDPKWREMRSHIYARDKGICWVCNEFVELSDYDLGHLVDRCMGGWDDYDNLAVMHTKCNLSKPRHTTLEEAMRWKLTPKQFAYMVPVPNPRPIYPHVTESKQENPTHGIVEPTAITPKRKRQPVDQGQPKESFSFNKLFSIFKHNNQGTITREPYLKNNAIQTNSLSAKKQQLFKEQCAKIKPGTVCYIHGNPNGGPMWRVIPPPYQKQDSFIMRTTPPGAKAPPMGAKGLINTIQVISGKLTSEIEIETGITKLQITPDGDNILVTMVATVKSNTGVRTQTIGMGHGQIPINEWNQAKRSGVNLSNFKEQYYRPPDKTA